MNKTRKTNNKKALITGASTGIGKSIAINLSKEGYYCYLIGRDKKKLELTLKEIRTTGSDGKVIIADLKKKKDILKIQNEASAISLIINCAGVWHNRQKAFFDTPLEKTPTKQIDEVVAVGINAPIHLTRLFLNDMKRKRRGKIINISGTFENGGAGWLHYFVSKKALEQFTIGLAQEVRDFGIQVNCISPSDTATSAYKKFFPKYAKNALDPKEIAKLALYLSSGEADNITGQVIEIRKTC